MGSNDAGNTKTLYKALPFPYTWSQSLLSSSDWISTPFPCGLRPSSKKVIIAMGNHFEYCCSIVLVFFSYSPDINRTGIQIQNNMIFVLQFLSPGNRLVSLIQISSSYSSPTLFNLLFQLNSIVCDLLNFLCFPALLI